MSAKVFAVPKADVLQERDFRILFQAASETRRERSRRFLKQEDACRSLVAEALVRHAYSVETGSDLDEESFRCNEFGKPYLSGGRLHFNIAHSGEWVICGIDSEEIGVDIERHHATSLAIATRFFAQEENDLLAQAKGPSERMRIFFRIWALKESYAKAIGKGLSCSFESFACLPAPGGQHAAFSSDDPALPRGYPRLMDIHPLYSCAVCTLRPSPKPVLIPIGVHALADALLRRTEV